MDQISNDATAAAREYLGMFLSGGNGREAVADALASGTDAELVDEAVRESGLSKSGEFDRDGLLQMLHVIREEYQARAEAERTYEFMGQELPTKTEFLGAVAAYWLRPDEVAGTTVSNTTLANEAIGAMEVEDAMRAYGFERDELAAAFYAHRTAAAVLWALAMA